MFEEQLIGKTEKERNYSIKDNLVYLRQVNRSAKKVMLPGVVALGEIFDMVEQYVKVKESVVYFGGKRYDGRNRAVHGELLKLANPSIIHIHIRPTTSASILHVKLNAYNSSHERLLSREYQVKGSDSVGKFLAGVNESYVELEGIEIGLVESGRRLDENKEFWEEDVQDGTILVLVSNQEIKKLTEYRENQQNPFLIPKPQPFSFTQPLTSSNRTSSCDEFEERLPNFKKKQKGKALYKKSKNQNKFNWESDSNSSEANRNEGFRALQIKKQKENSSTELQGSFLKKSDRKDGQKFSLRDRFQIKQQMRKLFQSEGLYQRETEVTKLEPPQIITDEFVEEIEEIDFMDDEDEIFDQKEINTRQLPKSLTLSNRISLTESIGKNKRTDIFNQLIPTRDIPTFLATPVSLNKQYSDSDSDEEDDEMVMRL